MSPRDGGAPNLAASQEITVPGGLGDTTQPHLPQSEFAFGAVVSGPHEMRRCVRMQCTAIRRARRRWGLLAAVLAAALAVDASMLRSGKNTIAVEVPSELLTATGELEPASSSFANASICPSSRVSPSASQLESRPARTRSSCSAPW